MCSLPRSERTGPHYDERNDAIHRPFQLSALSTNLESVERRDVCMVMSEFWVVLSVSNVEEKVQERVVT